MTLEVFADSDGWWRWRARAENGRTQFTAGESFATKSNAVRAARRVAQLLEGATRVRVEVQ